MKNYDKEIKKHRRAIAQLERRQQKEWLKKNLRRPQITPQEITNVAIALLAARMKVD